jgi:hypothetical protein
VARCGRRWAVPEVARDVNRLGIEASARRRHDVSAGGQDARAAAAPHSGWRSGRRRAGCQSLPFHQDAAGAPRRGG